MFARHFAHHPPTVFQKVRGELRMLSGDMLAIMVAVVMSITMCTALGFFVEARRPRD